MPASAAKPAEKVPGPILVIEDDPVTGRLIEGAFTKLGRKVVVAPSASDALETVALTPPELILLDLVLPDADGRMLLAEWRSTPSTATIPVIVMTVSSTPEIRHQCLALGASEFIEKPVDVAVLTAATQRLLAAPTAQVDADVDPLTGVASRAALVHAYKRLSAGLTPDALLAVAVLDVDHFRAVNDSCGRETGDVVLRGLADLIRMSTASGQVVGRWQGDQFLTMLPGVEEQEAANWLERCLEALQQQPFASDQGATFHVSFSGGVVEAEPDASFEEIVGAVFSRLYLAKEGGRARIVSSVTDTEAPEVTVLLAADDDVVAAIVRSSLEAHGLVVEHCHDGEQAWEKAQQERIGLFLLDVNMPKMDGFELLALLRGDPGYARVPVAMLTGVGDEAALERALALGADDYLVKPISSHELVAHVQHLLTRWVEGRLHELQGSKLYRRGIDLLHDVFDCVRAEARLSIKDLSVLALRIVEDLEKQPAKLLGQVMNPVVLHDDYLAQHSLNSAILATIVGQELGLEGDDLDWLCVAAMLHEVGCVRLPDGLLQKTGELTEEERALLRRRPEFSHEIINELAPEYGEAAKISLQVHERPDGSGYPAGLKGNEIALEAQILGAVEVFEALTHSRPYRESPQAASEAVKYLLDSSNTQFLDRVLKALIAKIGIYPVGSYVLLNTDETALVLEHRESNPMRPLLAVVADRSGKPLASPRVTDPMLNPQINIRQSVAPPEIGAG
ncbi:MAG: response regulator [Acidobacteriota bacterium]